MGLLFKIFGIGLGVGTFAGLLSLGAGILINPALIYLAQMEGNERKGTAFAIIAVVGLVGFFQYAVFPYGGNVNWKWVGLITIGGVTGCVLGVFLSGFFSAETYRKVFGIFLLYVSLRMIGVIDYVSSLFK